MERGCTEYLRTRGRWCVSCLSGGVFTLFLLVAMCFNMRVSGAWCFETNRKQQRNMTEKTRRYFERHFKMPFVKTLSKAGPFGLPVLSPCTEIPRGLVGCDEIRGSTRRDLFVHCHTTDDRLEKFWLDMEKYIPLLSEFRGVYPPDFSQFSDMDVAACIWNLYRLRVTASLFAANGLQVLPIATWWGRDSFEICFDGLPRKSIIGVSTVGTIRRTECRQIFREGYSEMIKRLDPEVVVLYGGRPPFELPGPKTVCFANTHHAWADKVQTRKEA